jgi:hypothetical protein
VYQPFPSGRALSQPGLSGRQREPAAHDSGVSVRTGLDHATGVSSDPSPAGQLSRLPTVAALWSRGFEAPNRPRIQAAQSIPPGTDVRVFAMDWPGRLRDVTLLAVPMLKRRSVHRPSLRRCQR